MAGIYDVSVYQQAGKTWNYNSTGAERVDAKHLPNADQPGSTGESGAANVSVKPWTPISETSSLVPRTTEYGSTIGNVQLSDEAADYLNRLKGKFGNMEFITVSKDMKSQVQMNAASYGNANKMVVLVDDEKLERMATDEAYRKKYEGIIAMSQAKLAEAGQSLAASGASVRSFGMSVDENGKESFFATVEKSLDIQKQRIERKAEEKREHRAAERKKAEKEAREERLHKTDDKEDAGTEDSVEKSAVDDKEYVTFEARFLDDLLAKIREYSYNSASSRVMTDAEMMVGGSVDYKG
ncbi:MAG: DUF6033 family protein [Eubacterium sp.]|nr:DUF6033 family protein [Eubacterium sp.]